MKIAVIVPVGPLDRFGYQHNCQAVVENLCGFATRVYMCSTTRNRAGVDVLLARHPNLEYISDARTWFDLDASGEEVFSVANLVRPTNLALARASEDQMDVALNVHINQYIPGSSQAALLRSCQSMLENGKAFEWLYKRYQLRDRLFDADTRVPWINNLHFVEKYYLEADSLHWRDEDGCVRIESGNFRRMNSRTVVDCPLERTWQDLERFKVFIRDYGDIRPGAMRSFDGARVLDFYQRKFNRKSLSTDALDATGKTIAETSRPDFISWALLGNYRHDPGRTRMRDIFIGGLRTAVSRAASVGREGMKRMRGTRRQ